jgi:hypothetical protein
MARRGDRPTGCVGRARETGCGGAGWLVRPGRSPRGPRADRPVKAGGGWRTACCGGGVRRSDLTGVEIYRGVVVPGTVAAGSVSAPTSCGAEKGPLTCVVRGSGWRSWSCRFGAVRGCPLCRATVAADRRRQRGPTGRAGRLNSHPTAADFTAVCTRKVEGMASSQQSSQADEQQRTPTDRSGSSTRTRTRATVGPTTNS